MEMEYENDEYFDSLPPGYRFCPLYYELLDFYLIKKVSNQPLPPHRIKNVNLYQYNPQQLSEKYRPHGDGEWYFFTSRDRKYKNGTRPNRAADNGYWKATGADKSIEKNDVVLGCMKTLVFYTGKAPKGSKTNWIMHEFLLKDQPSTIRRHEDDMRLNDVVLCRIRRQSRRDRKKKESNENNSNINSTSIENDRSPESEERELNMEIEELPAIDNAIVAYSRDEEEEIDDLEDDDEYFDSLPPGFRFCPMDYELLEYYLTKKVSNQTLPRNRMKNVNVYKHNPQQLSEKYRPQGDGEWYFFSSRKRKYKNGTRPDRAAGNGYWKATGADKKIMKNSIVLGYMKTLVFYKGRPPHGSKTNWIMHEYLLKDQPSIIRRHEDDMRLNDVVLCRIRKQTRGDNKKKEEINESENNNNNNNNSTIVENNSTPESGNTNIETTRSSENPNIQINTTIPIDIQPIQIHYWNQDSYSLENFSDQRDNNFYNIHQDFTPHLIEAPPVSSANTVPELQQSDFEMPLFQYDSDLPEDYFPYFSDKFGDSIPNLSFL